MKNMRRISLVFMLLTLSLAQQSIARTGYHIHLKMKDVKDSMVFLVHFYGEPLPKIYKSDSAKFVNGEADLKSDDPNFVGGIYMLLLSDKQTNFQLLMTGGDDISITATKSKLPDGVVFKNSPENTKFQEYEDFLKDYGKKQQKLQDEYAASKTADDSAAVRKKMIAAGKELTNYRHDFIKANPHTLLATLLTAMESPEVPEGDHFLEDGKTKDSAFAYNYYKSHFWDNFNMQDDRLINTPFLDPKITEYMNKLVLPWPDSVEHEADVLLKKADGTKEIYKYVLWWITRNVENSKIMGMDEVFVYLVENYYMKGKAFWLKPDELQKYIDRAMKIAPNVIGNVAPEVKLNNVVTKKEESLQGTKANYTLLVFYSPSCGHCQHEIPLLDSAYEASLKDKGLKIFTVATEGEEKAITDFLTKHNIDKKWINTWDPDHVGDWRGKYDVYSTPTIYLLDDKKIIRGKRLDHSNIGSVIDMLERKAKDKAKENSKNKSK